MLSPPVKEEMLWADETAQKEVRTTRARPTGLITPHPHPATATATAPTFTCALTRALTRWARSAAG